MESDFESNTSVVAPPLYEFPYEIQAPVHILPLGKAPNLLEEPYFRPDYGIHNVILDGKWKIYPTLYSEDSCSISTPSSSQTTVLIDDNSLIQCGKQTEKEPLISTLLLCVSCKKRFTSQTRHNYLVISLLLCSNMTLSRSEVVQHVRDSMQRAHIGKGPEELQNGKDFYKYFFTNFPDLRKYFKGAEHFTAEDVQKSERFEKQGQRILLACWILTNTFEDPETFKAYARETVTRHRQFKMDPSLWSAFFVVFKGYLESKGSTLTADQKAAWDKLGEEFNAECQSHLKDSGLPHV